MNKITLKEIDRTEALYYLGYRGSRPDTKTAEGLFYCEKMILSEISPAYVMKVIEKDDPVLVGDDIEDFLCDSKKAVLFCATLGVGADRIIQKARLISPELQLISDALCNAAIEQVCDSVEDIIREKFDGASLTNRYSPGYGDFPIEMQKEILRRLDAKKYIGVTCLDSFMMTPSKSVTAVVGIENGDN
jgi:5-methyltetrahydrofolate--homocysteine methyltransferase